MSDKEVFLTMNRICHFNELAWEIKQFTNHQHVCETDIENWFSNKAVVLLSDIINLLLNSHQ